MVECRVAASRMNWVFSSVILRYSGRGYMDIVVSLSNSVIRMHFSKKLSSEE